MSKERQAVRRLFAAANVHWSEGGGSGIASMDRYWFCETPSLFPSQYEIQQNPLLGFQPETRNTFEGYARPQKPSERMVVSVTTSKFAGRAFDEFQCHVEKGSQKSWRVFE